MDEMFGSSGGAAGAAAKGEGGDASGEPPMSEEEMMKQFEKIMAEMGLDGGRAGGAGPSASGTGAGASQQSSNNQPPANFQDAIKSTMSRLRESNSGNNAGGAGGANPFGDFSDEDMAKLLAGLGGEGGMPEGEEGMANMLEKMMGELMSKEVLHEPLKELRDKVSTRHAQYCDTLPVADKSLPLSALLPAAVPPLPRFTAVRCIIRRHDKIQRAVQMR